MSIGLKVQTEVRTLARKLGLLRVLSRARQMLPRRSEPAYEERLRAAMDATIRPGDVVWDVGANLGLYTTFFAERVGSAGLVCAFEPAPACFAALTERTRGLPQVSALNMALADADRTMTLNIATDPLAATHSLAAEKPGAASVEIRAARGDTLVAAGETLPPNVVKIDVEGFEEEVLEGADALLRSRDLRAVFIEMHFGILESRSRRHAPTRIVDRLKRNGFSVRWLDASHVMAARN